MADSNVVHRSPPINKPLDPPSHEPDNVRSYAAAIGKPDGQITFASVVSPKPQPRFPDVPLPARQYGSKDGVPSISFSAAEYQAAVKPLRFTLVAKFQIGRPPLPVIKQFVSTNWNVKGQITMSANWDDRHVVFILDSEQDVTAALTCPYRKVQNTYFRIFRWTPDYNPKRETTLITKWVRLPGLPMEFFNRSFIKAIVSSFAEFLDIDERTKAMNSLMAARVCVELDVKQPVPNRLWINLPGDKGFYQDITIEGKMEYCSACKLHGHARESCRKYAKITSETTKIIATETKKSNPSEMDWQVVNRSKGKQTVAIPSPNPTNSHYQELGQNPPPSENILADDTSRTLVPNLDDNNADAQQEQQTLLPDKTSTDQENQGPGEDVQTETQIITNESLTIVAMVPSNPKVVDSSNMEIRRSHRIKHTTANNQLFVYSDGRRLPGPRRSPSKVHFKPQPEVIIFSDKGDEE